MMNQQDHIDPQQHLTQATSSQVNQTQDKALSPPLEKRWRKARTKESKGSFQMSAVVEQRSRLLVHSLGYSFLVLSLVDYVHIVIPPQLTNPVWEFQTIGALVEHAAIPLLGLMFVFYRHQGYIEKREKRLLVFLSRVSLLLGLLYLLMLPLGVGDTWRIYQNTNAQITTQLTQQVQQFQQIKGQLNQATTNEQIQNLLASLAPQGRPEKINNPQAFKNQFLAQVSQAEQNIQVQAKTAQNNQNITLIKNSVKWNLGTLITATLFIWIWYVTRWVRKNKF